MKKKNKEFFTRDRQLIGTEIGKQQPLFIAIVGKLGFDDFYFLTIFKQKLSDLETLVIGPNTQARTLASLGVL